MKRILPLCLIVAACARVRVASFDTQSRTFTLSGNRHAGEKDFAQKAQEYCQGDTPFLLGCADGSRATAVVMDNRGNWGTGVANAHDAYRCTYQCR